MMFPIAMVLSSTSLNAPSDGQPIHKWSHTNLIDPHDERYKPYICPRHPPNSKGRPSRPYVFPTELLSFMLLDIRSEYLSYLFLTEAWDDEEIEERLAVNPFPAFLRVSHQFREIAFNVIQDAFGARRDADGWCEIPRHTSFVPT